MLKAERRDCGAGYDSAASDAEDIDDDMRGRSADDEEMDMADEDDDMIIDEMDNQMNENDLDDDEDLDEDDDDQIMDEADDQKDEEEDDECDPKSRSLEKSKESSIEKSPESSSESESESNPDEETIEQRRRDFISDGHELEQAFQIVKKLLYEEKTKQVYQKISELENESSMEYQKPLEALIAKHKLKAEVAKTRLQLQKYLTQTYHDSEALAAHQNLENEKCQLYDTVRMELEDKIRKVEEDRHHIDLQTDILESQMPRTPKHRSGTPSSRPAAKERRKKPQVVSGPVLIYMLDENDIMEDWTLIKKALKQKQSSKRRLGGLGSLNSVGYMARYQDGKLNYQGDFYNKGHRIIIDQQGDMPVHATITAINTGEIWVRKSDGNKSKLYIAQLQKGKYTIKRVPSAY